MDRCMSKAVDINAVSDEETMNDIFGCNYATNNDNSESVYAAIFGFKNVYLRSKHVQLLDYVLDSKVKLYMESALKIQRNARMAPLRKGYLLKRRYATKVASHIRAMINKTFYSKLRRVTDRNARKCSYG